MNKGIWCAETYSPYHDLQNHYIGPTTISNKMAPEIKLSHETWFSVYIGYKEVQTYTLETVACNAFH